MARLNIELSINRDQRFQELLIKVGDRQKAKGILWELWELAQQYWVPNRKPIPREVWDRSGLPQALLDVRLASLRDDGIYAAGAEEQFAWLFQKIDAGRAGGKKSAEKRVKKRVKSEPLKQIQASLKQRSSDAQATLNQASSESNPPYSLLPSPYSLNTRLASLGGEVSPLPDKIQNNVGFFIGRYVRAYQKRYGPKARPELRDGKTQGLISTFVKSQPVERACQLIEAYLQMDDKWFLTKSHDFGTFKENLQKVGLALDTGNQSPSTTVNIADILARKQREELSDEAG